MMDKLPLFQLMAFMASLCPCSSEERPFEPLVRVDSSIVQATGGVCLDGLAPGYYIRLPRNDSGVRSWRIHLQGSGGWCWNTLDCLARSYSRQGSANLWPAKVDGAVYGFLSSNLSVNLGFGDWGAVYVIYCDGSSFTGDRAEPLNVQGRQIYFRGKRVFHAVMLDLERRFKLMSTAKEVILSGTSAGGLATFLHADHFLDYFNSSTRVAFLSDAGVFLDHKDIEGNNTFRQQIISGLSLWNATGSLNPSCVDEWKVDQKEWHCLFVRSAFKHFKSSSKEKFFVLNSLYDKFNIFNILAIGCDPATKGSCNAFELVSLQAYRETMQDALSELCADGLQAVFASACYQHEESCQNADWTQLTINNVTLSQAVELWYYGNKSTILFDELFFPNNESCVKDISHGPC